MIKKILILLLIFTSMSCAQDGLSKFEMRGFRTLDTKSSAFTADPMSAKIAHNIDFGINPGSLTLRKGYDVVSTMPGQDSIWVFPLRYADGTSQLLIVADSAGVGYGGLYLTDKGTTDISTIADLTKIWSYWGVTKQPKVSQYRDNIYISNGANKTVYYDGDKKVAREFPINVPGEPWVVPLTTAGLLSGEYVYKIGIISIGEVGSIGKEGIVTSRIRTDSNQVLLTDFQLPVEDSTSSLNNAKSGITPNVVLNNTEYWVVINTDSVWYDSDGDATEVEIQLGIRDAINDEAGLSDFVATAVGEGQTHVENETGQFDTLYVSSNIDIDFQYRFKINLRRSAPNLGKLTREDSAGSAITTFVLDTTVLGTLTVVENRSDLLHSWSTKLIVPERVGREYSRYGSPGYIGKDTVGIDAGSRPYYGIYRGYRPDTNATGDNISNIVGYSYMSAFYDSLTQLTSDTGRAIFLYSDSLGGDTTQYYEIALPRVPYGNTDYYVDLYRAPLLTVTYDSTINYDTLVIGITENCTWTYDKDYIDNEGLGTGKPKKGKWVWVCEERNDFEYTQSSSVHVTSTKVLPKGDTLVGNYKRIGRFPYNVITVKDSISYDSLYLSDGYVDLSSNAGIPPLFSSMFTMNGRMFGVAGSKLYYSGIDIELLGLSNKTWEDFNYIPISEDDGDFIVLAYPDKNIIRVFKNRSSYIIREVDDEFLVMNLSDQTAHVTIETSSNIGMVARRSFQRGIEGDYFLSEHGVILTGASEVLENSFPSKLLSGNLDNFTKKTLFSTSKSVSYYLNKERKYLLCIGDTTYVYDAKVDAWSTWDLTFNSAFSYSAGTSDNVGDTMYFVPKGSASLCRYGTDSTDAGTIIDMVWQSQDLLVSTDIKAIHKVGFWLEDGSSTDSLYFHLYNSAGSLLDSIIIDSLDNVYNGSALKPNESQFYYFKLSTTASDTLGTMKINGIDIIYEPKKYEYKYK